MNILADENISQQIVDKLRLDKHKVYYIFEMARGSNDSTVLDLAIQQKALLITGDKDFGEMVFRQHLQASGVLLVRLTTLPPTEEAELAAMVINEYGERLLKAFTVITTRGVRIHPV
jgi:predicted nuclease of predicted toxin-antitoxin system